MQHECWGHFTGKAPEAEVSLFVPGKHEEVGRQG